jgi:hypothetical protein
VALGYTDQGSTFTFGPQTAAVTVEEEFYPIDEAIVSYSGKITFALAEQTRQNLALSLNAGIGSSLVAASQGVNVSDNSLWQEPPAAGTEPRIMLGWDAIPFAGSGGANIDPFTRIVIRKCLQIGQITRMARRGNNKAMYAVEFGIIKPTGVQPFRFTFEPSLAS